MSGYKPISILPSVSNTLEHHVSKIILDHICETYPISDRQWGFMHHRSSTSALISVIYDWLSALDNGQEVCVVLFDIQKTFDSVTSPTSTAKIGVNWPYILWGAELLDRLHAVVRIQLKSFFFFSFWNLEQW